MACQRACRNNTASGRQCSGLQQAWLSARLPLAWSLRVQSHMQGAQPHGLEEKVQPQQACCRAQCQQQQQVGWCRVLGGRKAATHKEAPICMGWRLPLGTDHHVQGLLIYTSHWPGEKQPGCQRASTQFVPFVVHLPPLQPVRHNAQNWVPTIQWEKGHVSRRTPYQVLVQK